MKKYQINIIVACICILCWYCLSRYQTNNDLESKYKYTVASILKFEVPLDGEDEAFLDYYVSGNRYKAIFTIVYYKRDSYKIGSRLFIKYLPSDPSISELILDINVPDTLRTIPINGWDSIPGVIKN